MNGSACGGETGSSGPVAPVAEGANGCYPACMGDSDVRQLERRWCTTWHPVDEAALLRERLRVGHLTDSQLRLAAYCGHPGAMLALGQSCVQAPPLSLSEWVGGLGQAGHSGVVVAALGAVGLALEHGLTFEGERARLRAVLDATLAWLECQCSAHHVTVCFLATLGGGAPDLAQRLVLVVYPAKVLSHSVQQATEFAEWLLSCLRQRGLSAEGADSAVRRAMGLPLAHWILTGKLDPCFLAAPYREDSSALFQGPPGDSGCSVPPSA